MTEANFCHHRIHILLGTDKKQTLESCSLQLQEHTEATHKGRLISVKGAATDLLSTSQLSLHKTRAETENIESFTMI